MQELVPVKWKNQLQVSGTHPCLYHCCLFFFSSLENTRKLSSTLETPSRLIPATTRCVGPPHDHLLFKKMLKWCFFKALQWREISFSARCGPFIVACTSPSHPPLLSARIPRPSWLQAAWCRPTATLMWPWTSTAWRPAPCPRALLSGTTLACVSLGKRNMLLWVALFPSSFFHFSSIVFLFFVAIINLANEGSSCHAAALCAAPLWNRALLSSPPRSAVSLWLLRLPPSHRPSAVWRGLTTCLLLTGKSCTTWAWSTWPCSSTPPPSTSSAPPSTWTRGWGSSTCYWQVPLQRGRNQVWSSLQMVPVCKPPTCPSRQWLWPTWKTWRTPPKPTSRPWPWMSEFFLLLFFLKRSVIHPERCRFASRFLLFQFQPSGQPQLCHLPLQPWWEKGSPGSVPGDGAEGQRAARQQQQRWIWLWGF